MNSPTPTASTLIESTDITHRAMKFKLSRGGTQKRIRDADAEALVKSTLGDEGQIVSRALFQDKGSLVYKYQDLANKMYNFHIKSTLPFGDDSSRLLPNAAYFDYTTQMGNFLSQLDNLKQQIVTNWFNIVQQDVNTRNASLAAQGKPQSATPNDYPTAAQMEARLYINWFPEPISTSNDFRFTLPADMVARMEQTYAEAIEAAGRDLYVRMLEPVSAFVAKLSKYTGAKGERFSSCFVENLNELTTALPKLNVNNDPVVDQMLASIKALVQPYVFQPDALKEDPIARANMKSQLEALESQLKGYAL